MTDQVNDAVRTAVERAAAAGEAWRATPPAERATVLEGVSDALLKHAEELWPAAAEETRLPEARLRGEIARTAAQFRLFAGVLRDGGWVEAVIDHPDPGATPPCPDLRRMNHPLGVVAVFAASNFPFAFSVAGGDTVSALAAGCPVVVKAHEGHPRTSDLTASVVRQALPDPDLLGLVHGFETGAPLVQHPLVTAVGFTGSLGGGTAIQKLIDERPDPIPFYGELGSVNPVVVLPSADPAEVASGFAASLTLGVGQFCTNPGLVFVPAEGGFEQAVAEAVAATSGGPMLTAKIREGYLRASGRLAGRLTVLASGGAVDGIIPQVFAADLEAFAEGLPELGEECFGPSAIVVRYRDPADLPAVLRRLPGSLTATVHAAGPEEARDLVPVLNRLAGRLIWNGWPTGVAVSWAMHHGGPWPASTAPAHTSVGAASIGRWTTPVAYQDWPADLLPPELRDDNPLGVPQRVDGRLRA
ncbi:aldehyde dehydrogenase (NADP(+)) [Microbispora bryophytorum]|uniref:Aldehyde dehydrogenase n=1 Tax=Microbispora bryophytorum TaxID=1460882 RepID=A0A8H9H5X2_9ACTN|nr:aldehyde dehydrogenase (NADP(+)) [Microbispora bryophytorum]MBD3140488.1 aldehyde dehydrogenase (NADP(+)) [Microbispora bryophytorum]TQS01764.1 aldehyde dehydrogenase (NADP(+)) [Microbispora bryophytorum]GGO30222.1 aldehyde dehydrogenase [Microbispora bryophytorum]